MTNPCMVKLKKWPIQSRLFGENRGRYLPCMRKFIKLSSIYILLLLIFFFLIFKLGLSTSSYSHNLILHIKANKQIQLICDVIGFY